MANKASGFSSNAGSVRNMERGQLVLERFILSSGYLIHQICSYLHQGYDTFITQFVRSGTRGSSIPSLSASSMRYVYNPVRKIWGKRIRYPIPSASAMRYVYNPVRKIWDKRIKHSIPPSIIDVVCL